MSFLNRLFGGSAVGHSLVSPADYKSRYMEAAAPHTLVDVRTAEEFREGYIPGAINISLQELDQKLKRIPKDKPVIVYCRSGNRSSFAVNVLTQAGYTEVYDLGGIIDWARHGLPITR
ncbi:MAG: rhodanese-like domain-containing protein [Caldilineaceae bacterium]|nr:rhodanese-like domain-containing protein [Caldilineaceae bacterium]